MKSQMLIAFEDDPDFKQASIQEQTFVKRQLLVLLQKDIYKMEQDCKEFQRQYSKFVDYSQSLLSSVVA